MRGSPCSLSDVCLNRQRIRLPRDCCFFFLLRTMAPQGGLGEGGPGDRGRRLQPLCREHPQRSLRPGSNRFRHRYAVRVSPVGVSAVGVSPVSPMERVCVCVCVYVAPASTVPTWMLRFSVRTSLSIEEGRDAEAEVRKCGKCGGAATLHVRLLLWSTQGGLLMAVNSSRCVYAYIPLFLPSRAVIFANSQTASFFSRSWCGEGVACLKVPHTRFRSW